MKKRGTPPGKPRQFATPADVALMRSLYLDQQRSTYWIGEQLGFAPSYVWTCLKRDGVKFRPNHKNRKCADCGKPCGAKHRCPYHMKIRHAETCRNYKRLTEHIHPSKWRASY